MNNRPTAFILMLSFFLFSCGSNTSTSTDNQTDETAVEETTTSPGHNMLTDDEKAAGWQLLFDGSSTDGWRTYGQPGVTGWTIEEGVLMTAGGNGDIMTEQQFENYELSLEWKISEGGNSGIIYNVVEDTAKYSTTYATGPEYQLIDDEGYDAELTATQVSGSNYDMHPPSEKAAKGPGEFNTARIIVNQGKVEHWLNGVKVVSYELWTPEWKEMVQQSKWKDFPGYGIGQKGHIALQDHGDEVAFRNIKIREL